jgi:hypothetical protein
MTEHAVLSQTAGQTNREIIAADGSLVGILKSRQSIGNWIIETCFVVFVSVSCSAVAESSVSALKRTPGICRKNNR